MDFYIIHFSIPLIFTFFITVIVIFFIFVYGRHSKFQPDYNNSIPVFEVVKALEKLCPINTSKKWKLYPFEHGCHRCWSQLVSLSFLKNELNLYGSVMAINSSSVNICSLIADVSKWPEWNPFFTSQYVVKSFHDKQLRRDHYMEAEQIISIVRETNKIQSHVFMYRFRDFSENKVGWFLFWNPKMLEFLYFLIQPIKNKNDSPMCLLTHIMGSESALLTSSVSLVSQRLRNIQDIISLSSLCIVPSLQLKSEDPAPQNESNPSNVIHQENYFSLSSIRARKRDIRNTTFVLVPFMPPVYEFWKRDVEFKLAVRNMDSAGSEKKLHGLKEHETNSKNQRLLRLPFRRASSDVGVKSKLLPDISKNSHSLEFFKDANSSISSGFKENVKIPKQKLDTTNEDFETKKNPLLKEKFLSQSKLRSLSETAVDKLEDCELSCKLTKNNDKGNVCKLQNINENVEDKLLAMDEESSKEMFNSSISDFEVVEKCEFAENRIAAFLTQGNYGAAELQAETLLASQFIDDMNSGNFQALGGWMFHSYHKGLCVLRKTTCSKFLKISSFLCQTELHVAPKDVWRFVKNPQFRFICDESVKSVEVLEKISGSQKLIHTYHEVGGFIKKELMDFCLLQTEREELSKYYSCFCSIEYDKCPFMKSVTRGSLRPSGWIVENIAKDANKSLVTYMIQVIISSPDSMFIQELSTMVPQSVHNLKNYITSKPM